MDEQELLPIEQPVPEIDIYKLITSPQEIIDEGASSYYTDWFDKWGTTPVEEIPIEEASKMAGFFFNAYKETPIDEIPENVKPLVMQTLIQVTAEDTKGTYQDWANSLPKPENLSEKAAYALLNAIPFYTPTQETVSRAGYTAGASLKGNLLDRNSLQEEFNYRVRRQQSGAGLITGGEAVGAFLDPIGIAGGAFTSGMLKANKMPPIVAGLLGSGAEGAAFGALMPVYPEFGDSRLLNTAGGAAAGFGFGAALMSPAIAAEGAKAAARASAVVSPEQQRLFPRGPETPREPVDFWDTRVPAERDELLTQQLQRGQEVPLTEGAAAGSLEPVPVTLNVKPFVHRVSKTISPDDARRVLTESNTDIRVLDEQIAQLTEKAGTVNRRKRRPIQRKIEELQSARERRLKTIDEQVNNNNAQIQRLNKVVDDAVSNPSIAGAVPRAIRAKRRALELEKENVLHLTGGNSHVDWADPLQVSAFRSFSLSANNKYTAPFPPVATGNKVEDAIAQANYTISVGSKGGQDSTISMPIEPEMVGFEPRRSLSSAGVRPSVQYKEDLAARGYGEESIRGFNVSASTARRVYNKDPDAFSGVRPDLRTKEAMGRTIINEEATDAQGAIIQGELAGYLPEEVAASMENFAYRMEGGWDNLEKLAAKIREEDIEQGYGSMVDFVMDPANTTRLMSGEYTEALQDLWIIAENRRTFYGDRLYDLQQEGLVNTQAYVQAFDEYMLATHITKIYKSIGSARGRALNQLKKAKQNMEKNARKTAKGVIIDNLFGVKCA